jgi:hypothetical protein
VEVRRADDVAANGACDGGVSGVCPCGVAGKTLCGNAPVVLATGQTPTSLAVDEANVYWTNRDGSVDKVPLGGGATIALAPATGSASANIAIDATTAFWITQQDLHMEQVSLAGGSAAEGTGGWVQGLWAEGGSLYQYVSAEGCTGPQLWGLFATSLGDGTTRHLAGISIDGFAIHGGTAYASGQVSCRQGMHHAVIAVPLAGGDATELASDHVDGGRYYEEHYGPLAVASGQVFFFVTTPGSSAKLLSVPLGGSAPPALLLDTGGAQPASLLADDRALYWPQGASVMTRPIPGGQ